MLPCTSWARCTHTFPDAVLSTKSISKALWGAGVRRASTAAGSGVTEGRAASHKHKVIPTSVSERATNTARAAGSVRRNDGAGCTQCGTLVLALIFSRNLFGVWRRLLVPSSRRGSYDTHQAMWRSAPPPPGNNKEKKNSSFGFSGESFSQSDKRI